VITVYNLFPLEAERAIQQHFTLSETLASPGGLTQRLCLPILMLCLADA
jgi:hypothetical protein